MRFTAAAGAAWAIRVKFTHGTQPGAAAWAVHLSLHAWARCAYIANTMGVTKFDKRAQTRFLKHLREHGLLYRAAEAANVTTETVRNHRKEDPDFEERYITTLELYRDDVEAEAHRRAIEGVEEDHYFKGEYTHTVRKYSDRLMELILKRHRPKEYREKIAVDATVSGGVLVMPANDMTSKQWEEEHDGTDTE